MLKVVALVTMAAAVAVTLTAQPASAQRGGAVAAGVVTGLAAGAIIGSAAANRNYYGGPGYVEPSYQPVYGPCHTEREQVIDEYGRSRWRRVRVCD